MTSVSARKGYSAASERNRGPLGAVILEVFPRTGRVLEVAAGSGQHAVAFAGALPGVRWLPTDLDPGALASIAAWREEAGLPNLEPPRRLDVTERPWDVGHVDAILCVNMLHISPWACAEALFAGAAELLVPAAPLVTYGPYRFDGVELAPSNEQFDASLRGRDPRWGIRAVEDLQAIAVAFVLESVRPLPANNHALVWRRL